MVDGDSSIHWWPKVQASGTGLTLMAAFGPTLDIPIPYWIRMAGFVLGGALLLWPIIAVIWQNSSNDKIRAIAGVILGPLLLGVAYAESHRPIRPSHPEQRASASASESAGLASRATKFIFACDVPPDPSVTDAERARQRKQFERDAKAWGDTIGFSILLSDIDGGFRLTIKAETAEAQARLIAAGGLATTAASYMDFRRVGQQIVVAVYSDILKGLEIFSLIPADPTNPQVNQVADNVAKLLGVPPGTCRLI
jgi:hypothetical protein